MAANTDMVYRRVGNSGLKISVLGLGGWLTYGGHVGNDIAFDCMKQAYDLGVNFFDLSENYSAGQAEVVMGQAFKKFGWNRNDIVVTTKIYWGQAHGENRINNVGLSRKHIVEGLRASLRRLDLEYVDIVYAHRPDRLTPMEETVRAFNHVIDRGWALYWGTSEWSADEIAEACGVAARLGLIAPIVEQPEYSLLKRGKVEGEFQRLYSRFGTGLTTWSPLKYGLLSGKYNDHADAPPEGSRFAAPPGANWIDAKREEWYGQGEWQQEIAKVTKLAPIAEKLGVSQAQLALAWCIKNPNVSAVIMGASKPEQVVENVGALKVLDKLTPELLAEIDGIVGAVVLDPDRV